MLKNLSLTKITKKLGLRKGSHTEMSKIKLKKRIHRFFNTDRSDKNYKIKWWLYINILDHGILRNLYHNFHKVDQNFYRAAQPNRTLLKKFASTGGKTVLSLRGSTSAPYWYEQEEACAELGLRLHNIALSATEPPAVEKVREFINFVGTCEKPLLIHCKSGADRTGLATFLYKIIFKNYIARDAKKSLSAIYFHNRFGKSKVLDDFVDLYLHDSNILGLSFEEWLYTVYKPESLQSSVETKRD